MDKRQIRELRKKLGLTQEAFAREVGVALQTVGRWESGRAKPSQMAIKIMKLLYESDIKLLEVK